MTAKDDAADLPRSAPAPAPAPPQDRSPWPEVTIPLRHPIKGVDGAEITSLRSRSPTSRRSSAWRTWSQQRESG